MSTSEPSVIDQPIVTPPPLTRSQRRHAERVEAEAKQVHQQIAQRFLSFFVESNDPESDEVKNKIAQLSAQWIVYCKAKRLNNSVHGLIRQFCEGTIKEYLYDKKNNLIQTEPIQGEGA